MTSADELLHPVRLRIVKAFLGERTLTTADLAQELDDVPAGSLYRHVARLAHAGVLEVVDERPVRGAVQRTYRLRLAAARIDPDLAAAMSPAEHRQAFMVYVAGMLADVDRYLAGGPVDPARDGADYRLGALWLSDAELADFLAGLADLIVPRMAHGPSPDRTRRMLYGVMLPDREAA